VIDFITIAFAIFIVVRQMNKLKRKEEAPPAVPTTKDCPQCLSSIPIKATRCAHCTAQLGAA
jgi:large conductance mechanosensitive channel